MTLSSFRQKVRWMPLIGALILFCLEVYCREYCYQIIIGSGPNGPVPFAIDQTPTGFMFVWLFALIITVLSALITVPRWQSFLALLMVGIAIFLPLGSEPPMAT